MADVTIDQDELVVTTAGLYHGGGMSVGIHEVTVDDQRYLFKEFKADVEADLGALTEAVAWRNGLPPADLQWLESVCAFPVKIVLKDDKASGILMGEAPARFGFLRKSGDRHNRSLDFLGTTEDRAGRTGVEFCEPPLRLAVLGLLGSMVNRLHQMGVVVGDLQPQNALYDPDPTDPAVFLLDCDSMLVQGRAAFSKHDPESLQCPWGPEDTFTHETDLYKFALLVVRGLAGNNSLAQVDPEWLSLLMPSDQVQRLQQLIVDGKVSRPAFGGLCRAWRSRVTATGELLASTDENLRSPWRGVSEAPAVGLPAAVVEPSTAQVDDVVPDAAEIAAMIANGSQRGSRGLKIAALVLALVIVAAVVAVILAGQ